jgi:pyruvate/2-oxoglutarate dehydrogenase complex dihydrolipoamide acyltransferase (E2) component
MALEPGGESARPSRMDQREPSAEKQIAAIIASAAKQPLLDAAFEIWCRRYRLDSIEGRPTAEQVRINRTLTPEQISAKLRSDRDHAHEGPMFGYVKRAHPHAGDDAIRQAIITAVKLEDATFTHFNWNGDFWDCVVRAVAKAAAEYPDFLETTYRDARNNVAYYYK